MSEVLDYIIDKTEDIFQKTKQGIIDILKSDFDEKVKSFVYTINETEHEFGLEGKDIEEILSITQNINLGLIDEVEVEDKDGNVIVMSKEEYVQRNLDGFKYKAKESIHLEFLLSEVEKVKELSEFACFGSLQMAKEHYLQAYKQNTLEEEVI